MNNQSKLLEGVLIDIPRTDEELKLQLKYMSLVRVSPRLCCTKADHPQWRTSILRLEEQLLRLATLHFLRDFRRVQFVERLAFLAINFSSSVRKRAQSAGRKQKATTARIRVGRPSTRNNKRQVASLEGLEMIPWASAPANVLASAAADRNLPIRNPTSCRR